MPETKEQYEKRLRKNHDEMVRTKATSLPYDKFRDRQERRNEAQRKEHWEKTRYLGEIR